MNNVAKSAIILVLATIIAKIIGFGRELVLASTYGISMYSDVYLTAMNIPLIIFTSIGAAIGTTFIPMYFEINQRFGEKRALNFTNNILNIVVFVCLVLTILGILFTDQIVKVFAVGFKNEAFDICVDFTRIFMGSMAFTGLSYIMTAYLQIRENFTIPGLMTIPRNIIIILSMIISIQYYNPYIMVWGSFIGIASEFLFQLPFAIKNGYKYKLNINIRDEYVKKTILLLGPIFIGVAVNQINTLVDKSLASTLVEGSISALNYSNKLNGFVMTLFITTITSVIYPTLSKLSSEQNKGTFIEIIVRSVNSIIILVIPISIGAIVLSKPIVRILFERGEFDPTATSMTAICLVMYSIGMIAFGLRDILGKIFYSLKDTKTPMINGIIAMIMNIFMNILFIKHLKYAGLALATSLSGIICIILLFSSLKRKVGYYGQDKILKVFSKVTISSIIMGIFTNKIYLYLSSNLGRGLLQEIIGFVITVVSSMVVYIVLVNIFRVEEIIIIKNLLKSKFTKESNLSK